MHANFCTVSKTRENTCMRILVRLQKPEKMRAFQSTKILLFSSRAFWVEAFCVSPHYFLRRVVVICNACKTSHSLRVTCATRLFQESVPEKLIRERTGHRSNALFRYEKKSAEQERNVNDLLGPPRDVVDVVDVPDLDLNYEVRDEELCNMPMTSEVFDIDMSKSVFHNCTFNFATK